MLKKIPSWLKYTLPIFIIFTIVLLVYYPGILESDSMVQWDQVQRAVFTNWHPAYNTIYIYLLTRIWNNPFFVLLVQCFILSFSFGMCLTKIKKYYNIKKKYLRLDITDYQDYISLMSEYSSKTTNKYISMTQYILHLIEADKLANSEIYHKLEEIENMKKNII